MNNEEMEKAIERLKKVTGKSMALPSVMDIANAFMGTDERWTPYGLRDALVELLQYTDPSEMADTVLAEYGLMRLPKDRDGEIIRVGDKVTCSHKAYEVPYIKVHIGKSMTCYHIGLGDGSYSMNPETLTHYEPTIKDVLRDFLSAVEEAKRKGYDDVPDEEYAECAEKLREVMDA